MTTKAIQSAGSRADSDALALVLAASLGLFLIFGVGFAQSDTLHDAAHDTRHAITFPCH